VRNAADPSPLPADPRAEALLGDPVEDLSPALRAASAAGVCVHCGLELGRHHRADDGPFCCNGCRAVYELIHHEGLDRYYDLKRCATAPPGELRPDAMAWLPPLLELAPTLAGSTVRRLRLDIQGIHCAACVWLLEQLFARHAAGKLLRINPALGTVDLAWDPEEGELSEFLAEVEGFGYRFGPPRKEGAGGSRDLLVRMGIAIAIAMNVMTFSLSYYFGLSPSDPIVYQLFGRISFALAGVSLVVGGWPFLRSAAQGLRRGVVHLDLPIALGMVLAFAGSAWSYAMSGPRAAYFDTITIFIALMLVGRWLQERVLERNRNALLASGGVADLYARRFEDGQLRTVSASALRAGDTLWIAPGDLVPVEGILLHRTATISLDWITGEADARDAEPGQLVPAGAFNAGAQGFRVAAREDFSGSRLNELIAGSDGGTRVEERGWWHRVATIYVASVLGFAVLGFAIWSGESLRRAVEVSVAVLVVTCPCALGLAVPLGRELAHAALRRKGVLLRRDDFLDRALRVRRVIFDKTGTLTRGQMSLTPGSRRRLLALPSEQREILSQLASRSTHPVSRCLSAALVLKPLGSRPPEAAIDFAPEQLDSLVEEAGCGLRWNDGRHEYRLGRPGWAGAAGRERVEAAGAEASAPGEESSPPATRASLRTLFTRDGVELADFEFDEEIRPDALDEVGRLRELGFELHVFSGDRSEKVRVLAEQLGLAPERSHGGMSPEAKAGAVRALRGDDALMVGDGLNDSLGFDAALCSATPAVDRAVLPQKADFYFLGDGIGAVRRALQTARHLRGIQRDNLIFAAAYNTLAVTLCLLGVVSPVVAAILMPLSSVTIVGITSARMSGEGTWMS
jgi:Cu2+-exporting ATPase